MSNAVSAVSNGLLVNANAMDVPSSSFVVAPATAAKGTNGVPLSCSAHMPSMPDDSAIWARSISVFASPVPIPE